MQYHHGYLLTGDTEAALDAAFSMSREILGREELRSHPDFSIFDEPLFSIEHARTVRKNSSQTSFEGKGRVFLINCSSMTREAANALLKTFEEPHALSYFFLVTLSPDHLPDTLRSRLVLLAFARPELPEDKIEFVRKFLHSDIGQRNKMAEKIISDREKAMNFLDVLETFLRIRMLENFSSGSVSDLEEVCRCRQMLFGRSSSPKLVLDHLVLALPRV